MSVARALLVLACLCLAPAADAATGGRSREKTAHKAPEKRPPPAKITPLAGAEVEPLRARMDKDCRLVRAQSFHVSLANLKGATFAACHDLHLVFIQGGYVVGEVPGVDVPWPDRIDTVSFRDVNGDGNEDLLMVYTVTSGARSTAVTRRVGAVLLNGGPGKFRHDKQAEAAIPEGRLTIDQVEAAARRVLLVPRPRGG